MAGVALRRAAGDGHAPGCSAGWDGGAGRSFALTEGGGAGDAFGLGLPVSNQTTALAITRDYKWELYSIKIDSRVN